MLSNHRRWVLGLTTQLVRERDNQGTGTHMTVSLGKRRQQRAQWLGLCRKVRAQSTCLLLTAQLGISSRGKEGLTHGTVSQVCDGNGVFPTSTHWEIGFSSLPTSSNGWHGVAVASSCHVL